MRRSFGHPDYDILLLHNSCVVLAGSECQHRRRVEGGKGGGSSLTKGIKHQRVCELSKHSENTHSCVALFFNSLK